MLIHNRVLLFPINTKGVSFKYRLIKINISGGNPGKDLNKLVNKAVSWFRRRFWELEKRNNVQKWSVLVHIDAHYYIAVPLRFKREVLNVELTYMQWKITLHEMNGEYELNFDNSLKNYEEELAMGWLNDLIRIHMAKYVDIFWIHSNTYYHREPLKIKSDTVDIFKGFSLKIYKQTKGFALCVEDTVKYLDKRSVEWYLKKKPDLKFDKPRYAIYKQGLSWYLIRIKMNTGETIGNLQMFNSKNPTKTVYAHLKEYLENQYSKLPSPALNKESPALSFQYTSNSEKTLSANGAWVYYTYGPESQEAAVYNSYSISPPWIRKKTIEEFINKYFSRFTLKIETKCISIPPAFFPIPELVFGNNKVQKPFNKDTQEGVKKRDWLFQVRNNLNKNGTYKKGILMDQHLIVPSTIPLDIIEQFKSILTEKIKTITKRNYDLNPSQYPVPAGRPSLARYYATIEKHLQNNNALNQKDNTIILILPPDPPRRLHDHLKTLLKNKRSQFLVASYKEPHKFGLCDFFEKKQKNSEEYAIKEGLEKRLKSYIGNIAYGVLFINRCWLFGLNKKLHHDLHVGIDISNKKVGLSLYISETKDILYFHDNNAASVNDPRTRREKLPTGLIKKYLYTFLKKNIDIFKVSPKSILIHRDGKAYGEECKGINEAIQLLKHEGILDSDTTVGILEIFKSSVTLPRIVTEKDNRISNPGWGTYYMINSNEALLLCTGFPSQFTGTAKPLIIRKVEGDFNLKNALQDINDLSYLGYTTPDKKQQLPVTIKIIDDLLTPDSYPIDTPGYDFVEDSSEIALNETGNLHNIKEYRGVI